MDNEQPINTDMCTINENNLASGLFSDYSSESLIVTSDINNGLSSLEGALCYDETTNEFVYVNMIQPNMNNSDSNTVSHSVFSALGNTIPSLLDLSMFNDGGQFLLLTNGSLIIPNEEDNASTNSDPFVLERTLNVVNTEDKRIVSVVSKSSDQNPHEFEEIQEKTSDVREKSKLSNNVDILEDGHLTCLFSKDDDLSIESEKQDSKTRYHCKLCSEKFSSLKQYKVHLLNHHKDKMHKCNYCGNSFNKLNNLILHEAIHNTKDTTCPLTSCQKKFKRLASLKAHVKLHEEEDALTCSECGEEFCHQLNLELHYKYQPQCRISTTMQTTNADKLLQCKLCDRKFEYVSQLLMHKKEHAKIKKALATKNYKKKSISSVPSSRINRCKMCPKWFFKPSQLIRHMRIHTGERPFECTECNKAFNQANSLKTHMLKHTGDRPYHCPFCSTGFSQRGNLRQHISRVHSIPKVEENVYKCVECSCIFKKLCSLNAHKNRVHQKRYCSDNDNPRTEKTENSITIENGFDDLQEDDLNELLDRKSYINTITVTLTRENGSVWNQRVFINKKGNNRYYKCSHCPKQSNKLKEIIKHLKFNILGRPFKCSYCSVSFSQQSTFLTHLTLHANAKTFLCDICQSSFATEAELELHTLIHPNPNQEMCMTCFKSFPQTEINNHQCVPLFQSTESGTNLETDKNRDLLEIKDKQKCDKNSILPPYICDFCKVTYDSYSELKQHLYTHNANLCETCCLLFPTKEKLEKHTFIHHEKELKNFPCEKCGKQFQTKHRLDAHVRSHDRIPATGYEFKCVQCAKTYKDKHSLKRHLKRIHKTESQVVPENFKISILSQNYEERTFQDKVNTGLEINATRVVENTESNFVTKLENRRHVNSDKSQDDSVSIHSSSGFLQSGICDNNGKPITNDESSSHKRELNGSNEITLPNKNISSDLLGIDSVGDCFFDTQSSNITMVEGEVDTLISDSSFSGVVIYRCTKCCQQYTTEQDLKKHFQESGDCNNGILNANSYFYACNTCFLTFKNLPSFFKHLQTHSDNHSFSCLYCGGPSRTQAELTQHIAQHALKKEYPCIHCGELSDSVENVKKHIIDTHLVSSADSKKTDGKRRKNIGSELLLTEKEKKILASHKPNKYSSISEKVLSSLLKNSVESEEFNGNDNPSGENDAASVVTNKKTTNSSAKEKTCSYCGRGFKKMNDLIRHKRTHTGEKPFKCDYCNKCFTVKSILNCHLKTHFTMNNIFCHICNRFFATVSSLKIHMRLHTGERPYKCAYCKDTFRTSGHRDNHHKRHLNDKNKAKAAQNSESILIKIVTRDNDTNVTEPQFIIPEISVPESFKFQDINLVHLQDPADPKLSQNSPCDDLFKKKMDFNGDVNIHSLQASYDCMMCDAKFDHLDLLKVHLRQHSKSDKSILSTKSSKVHKIQRHTEKLILLTQDENKRNGPADYSETKTDRNDWIGQNSLSLKKNESMSDFFVMDKSYDLNCIMQDFFPDDDK